MYPQYKERDMTKYKFDIGPHLQEIQVVAKDMFDGLGLRQYYRKKQEADDLIYSACRVMAPSDIIVISTDKDLHQIQYRMKHTKVYEHIKGDFVPDYDYDPVIAKALSGDTSDNIDGYYGIGPKKSENLARSPQLLNEFLDNNDRHTFLRNMLLVDLGLNRDLLANDFYVIKSMTKKVSVDKNKIMDCAKKYKLVDIITGYHNIVVPFNRLMNNEE